MDTDSGFDDDFLPFRDVINEYYAKDISKKIKSTFKAKCESGKHVASSPPYGYLKDSGDKNRWVIDEVAAPIVRRIFRMTYEPYKAVYDMSKSLSGLKKMKYDKEHEHELAMYENTRADLKMLLSEGERITPKAWRTERERLEKEMPTLRNERARACHDLAFAEVISYNKANLERVEQNEGRQQDKMQSRGKRREEEL